MRSNQCCTSKRITQACRPPNPEQPGSAWPTMNVFDGALPTRNCQYGHYSPARSASQSGRSGRPAAAYRRKTSCCISLRVLQFATVECLTRTALSTARPLTTNIQHCEPRQMQMHGARQHWRHLCFRQALRSLSSGLHAQTIENDRPLQHLAYARACSSHLIFNACCLSL
jgi:hypothetical protein